MSATGNAPRPWVKLWRDERGSFAQLPLYCRALAAEILKIADAEGRIELGGKAPHEAIAFALGADRSDRRLLAKHLPMLIADGYLEHVEDALIVVGWARWQSPDPTTKQPRPRHEATTKRPRSDHETEAKSPESHAPILQEGEGEGDVDPLTPLHSCEPEGARDPEPRAERWFGHDVIEVTGAELRERGKRWQTPGLDGDAGKVRPVVDALEGVPRVTALEWCRRWARDPDTRRFTVDSLAHYVAATRNGGAGWGKRAMRRVATDAEHEAGVEAWRALGLSVMEDA